MLIQMHVLIPLQGTTKQMYTGAPVGDSELLQLSVRLFKKTMASNQTSDLERPQPGTSSAPAAPPAEVCVS